MKSISHVYESLLTPENLELAILSASKNKSQKSRTTQEHIEWIKLHKEEAIAHMQAELTAFANDPSNVKIFDHHSPVLIHDLSCNKDRVIVKPPFLYEQIYHHAIIQVIEDIIMRGMYIYNCASIPNRGGTYGKEALEKFIEKHPEKCKYYLKMDIHHFFQSIDHIIMINLLARYIKDNVFLALVFQLIQSYEDSPDKGLPIGYYTSQWFANWYLQAFDHFVKEQLFAPFYIRYMDDMVILGPNKRELWKMLISIQEYLASIGLCLNDKTAINKLNDKPIDFMGYLFYFGHTGLRKNIMIHATRIAGRIGHNGYDYLNSCRELSLLGWIERTDSYNVYLKYIKPNVDVKRLKQEVSKHARDEKIKKRIEYLQQKVIEEREDMKIVYSEMEYSGLLACYRAEGEKLDSPEDLIGPCEMELNNLLEYVNNRQPY